MNTGGPNYKDPISEFNSRWSVPESDQVDFAAFRNRFLIAAKHVLVNKVFDEIDFEDRFRSLLGLPPSNVTTIDRIANSNDIFDESTFIYDYLVAARIDGSSNFREFIRAIQYIFSILEELRPIGWDAIEDVLYESLSEAISLTPNVNISLSSAGDSITILPAGAKELDKALVNENLIWLVPYPRSRDCFIKSLKLFLENDPEKFPEILDNTRKAIEFLLQDVLGNKRTLENNVQDLGRYLKQNGISDEIRNLYIKFLDYYSKYQNEKVKHGTHSNYKEIEFIIYQTGIFIRMLQTLR